MKINKRVVALGLFLAGLTAATSALAARQWAWQIGYFDANGVMVGSITYPCSGGQTVQGVLVGTPVEIWSERCFGFDPPDED